MRRTRVTKMYRPAGGSSSEEDTDFYGFGDVDDGEPRRIRESHNQNISQEVDYFEVFIREVRNDNLQAVADALQKVPSKIDALSGNWNALMYACNQGFIAIVEFLIHQGADPCFHNADLFTPLMAACTSSGVEEERVLQCANLLLASDVNIDQADHRGVTALMYACKSGYLSVAQALINASANLNLQDSQGWTALFWAVTYGSFPIVQVLVSAGAKKKKKDVRGRTAYLIAYARGNHEVTKLLCPKELCGELFEEQTNDDFSVFKTKPVYFDLMNNTLGKPQRIDMSGRKLDKETCLEKGLDLSTFLTITDKELLELGIKYPWQRRQTLEHIKALHMQPWKVAEIKSGEEKAVTSDHMTYDIATKHMLELCNRLMFLKSSVAYLSYQCPLERICGNEKAQRTFRPKLRNVISMSIKQMKLITQALETVVMNVIDAEDEVVSPSDLITNEQSNPRKYFFVFSSLWTLFATATVGVTAVVMWKKCIFTRGFLTKNFPIVSIKLPSVITSRWS